MCCMKAPWVFKVSALVTLGMGAGLHTLAIVIGRERFVREVFTPAFDAVFAVPMIIAAVAGFLSWRRFEGSRLQRAGFVLLLVLFTASVPIHVRTLVTWSTDYVLGF